MKYQHIFLDWFNNYLTISVMAEHYLMSVEDITKAINKGRIVHESQFGPILEYVTAC